jgi:hypothetical protein
MLKNFLNTLFLIGKQRHVKQRLADLEEVQIRIQRLRLEMALLQQELHQPQSSEIEARRTLQFRTKQMALEGLALAWIGRDQWNYPAEIRGARVRRRVS